MVVDDGIERSRLVADNSTAMYFDVEIEPAVGSSTLKTSKNFDASVFETEIRYFARHRRPPDNMLSTTVIQ